MTSLAEHFKQILISNGVGTSDPANDWFINIPHFPDNPIQVISLRDSGSPSGPEYLMDDTEIDNHSCTIEVRSKTYLTGYSKCDEAKGTLAFTKDLTVDNTNYWSIREIVPVTWYANDGEGHFLFTCRLLAQREK